MSGARGISPCKAGGKSYRAIRAARSASVSNLPTNTFERRL